VTMPFYVSPEQVMKDRADYARKGIARGRSLVALECEAGVLIVADNASRTLSKISEIYDRIAFAAVGKYNEFQLLKVAGVRHADLKGYSYSREDVSAKELANAYAQTLGQIFTHEMKPYEVELLVAEVGADPEGDAMYHVLYDGVVMDEQDHAVLGGNAESISEALTSQFEPNMDLAKAVKLGAKVLAPDGEPLGAEQLAVARRHRNAAFAIQRQRCGALKHDVRHKTPPKCTLCHCSGGTATGQFASETKINGINDLVRTASGSPSGTKTSYEIRTCTTV